MRSPPTAEDVRPALEGRAILPPLAALPVDLAERVADLLRRAGVTYLGGQPSLVLQEEGGDRRLVIEVGAFEFDALAHALHGLALPRPQTHDVAKDLLEAAGVRVERAAVVRREGDVYYALVTVRGGDGQQRDVDARPSDAVNLALRAGAPLYVAEYLLAPPAASSDQPPD